jgi:DNA polymerase III epsilon subunit-like protein
VWDGETKLSDLIIRITGIQQKDLEEFGVTHQEGFLRLIDLMESCDAVVAHNKAFDKGFFDAWCKKLISDAQEIKELPWICTVNDVDYLDSGSSKKLTYLGADHGFLNPFSHRAVFDVLTMLVVLSNYDIEVVIEGSKQPSIVIEAQVSFQDKDKARERGFKWDPNKRKWLKPMKRAKWEAEEFPFDTRIVE